MLKHVFKLCGIVAVALIGAGFGLGVTPASACGYSGCGGGYYVAAPVVAAPVIVQPAAVVVAPVAPVFSYYQGGCGGCGCGGCGCGGCGAGYYSGYSYPSAYGVAVEEQVVVGPRFYRPRAYGSRYYGRYHGARYYGRRPVVARY